MQLAKQEVSEVKERGGFDKSNITIFFILLLQRLLRKLKYFSKPTRTINLSSDIVLISVSSNLSDIAKISRGRTISNDRGKRMESFLSRILSFLLHARLLHVS